ncbi:hypothetical protein FDP41_001427 [Naegleria fowleri]|nr:uncharacterized protein FDP41_001427 [Naegleria fowleri]KAF0979563.1 hypothetical protein FDP41_001427 [Naegleria fowleri]
MTASFSISSAPTMLSNEIEITVQRSNHPLTHLLHDSKIGDVIQVSGPQGNFYFNVSDLRFENIKHLVLIAGGLGVTPLISIMKYISGNMLYFYHVTLIYSASTVDDFCFVNDISNIVSNFPNIKCKLLASTSPTSSIPQALEPILTSDRKIDVHYLKNNLNEEQRKEAIFFVCGPISMVKDVSAALQELSVDMDRIYHQ